MWIVIVLICVSVLAMVFSAKDKTSHNSGRDFLEKEAKTIKCKYKKNGTIIELWEKSKTDTDFIHTGSIDISINLIFPLEKKAKTTTLARLLEISRAVSRGTLPDVLK